MNKYLWWGINSAGQDQKGVLSAISQEDLKSLLLQEGVALLSCKVYQENSFKNVLNFSLKISLEQKAFFLEQLATLINSGVELLKALELVVKQVKNKKLKDAIDKVISNVASGESLSDALSKHKNIFTDFMIHVTRSGEDAGKLGFVLKNLSDYLNSCLSLKKKVTQACLLPFITLTFAISIILGLFIFVIPQFEDFFVSMDKPVPDITKFIMSISLFLRSANIALFGLGLLIVVLICKLIFKIKRVSFIKDKIILRLWVLGKLFLFFDLVSFLQIVSMFLSSGIPLKQALELSSKSLKNRYLQNKLNIVTKLVSQGQSLQSAMHSIGDSIFPENLVAVVSVGEHSGNLDIMLQKAAKLFQRDLDNKLKLITTLLQPILMIFIGLLIIFLLLAVYMPIFNMASLV